MAEEATVFECALCGRTDAERPAGFLGLDLEAREGSVESHWYRGFCSPDHAAAWFARPLPEPDQVTTWTPSTRAQEWRSWLGLVGGGVGLLAILTLAAIGAVSVLR